METTQTAPRGRAPPPPGSAPRALLPGMMAYVTVPITFALRLTVSKQLAAHYYHPMACPGTGPGDP